MSSAVRPPLEYSAIKVDVSNVSTSCNYKVLVVHRESTCREIINSLYKKLKICQYSAAELIIESEITINDETASVLLEPTDQPMYTCECFPKGSVCFYLKPADGRAKMERQDSNQNDTQSQKTQAASGHQLTIQRIRKSLEKLKRKSTTASGNASVSSKTSTPQTSTPRTLPPKIKAPISQSQENLTNKANLASRSMFMESRDERRRAKETDRGPGLSSKSFTTDNDVPLRAKRSDIASRTAANRHSINIPNNYAYQPPKYTGTHGYSGIPLPSSTVAYSSMVSSAGVLGGPTRRQTAPKSSTSYSSEADCLIVYDNSDSGTPPSVIQPLTSLPRSHVMSQKRSDQNGLKATGILDKQVKATGILDKPVKTTGPSRNLEDSGIDVKTPLQHSDIQNSHIETAIPGSAFRARVQSCGSDPRRPLSNRSKTHDHGLLSPNIVTHDTGLGFRSSSQTGLKRTDSHASLQSLPVSGYQKDYSPYLFEPIGQSQMAKAQSCTTLNKNKVSRRRSLPPLDVSQEKLEEKKSMLSKVLAQKISYLLSTSEVGGGARGPSEQTQYTDKYKRTNGIADNKNADDDGDNLSLADMEVANILEGKPEHPTDADVEDYLACVEQSGSNKESTPVKKERRKQQSSPDHTKYDYQPYQHRKPSFDQFLEQSMDSFLSSGNGSLPIPVSKNNIPNIKSSIEYPSSSTRQTKTNNIISRSIDEFKIHREPPSPKESTSRPMLARSSSFHKNQADSPEQSSPQINGAVVKPPQDADNITPLTLFALLRTHHLLGFTFQKGASRSFGVKVQRYLRQSNSINDGEPTPHCYLVMVQDYTADCPKEVKHQIKIDDVIVEVNGHSVLQSSDKVVRTLFDARATLHVVIAREMPLVSIQTTTKLAENTVNSREKYAQPKNHDKTPNGNGFASSPAVSNLVFSYDGTTGYSSTSPNASSPEALYGVGKTTDTTKSSPKSHHLSLFHSTDDDGPTFVL